MNIEMDETRGFKLIAHLMEHVQNLAKVLNSNRMDLDYLEFN
jgi:hypothetical protein